MAKSYWCPDCMELTEAVRVYECDADGWVGDTSRCEYCNKFVSRRDDDGCESCFAEVEEVEVVTDHDGNLIREVDYEPNSKSLAERRKIEFEKQNKKTAKKSQDALTKLLTETVETTWSEVSVGQKIIAKDWKGNLDTLRDATVLSVIVAGENSASPVLPGSLIVLVEQYGLLIEVHSPEETVLVRADETKLVTVAPVEDRFVLKNGDDAHSSGVKFVSANVSLAATAERNVYMGEIMGKNSASTAHQTLIGAFFEPKEARAFARVARATAAELRSRILVDEIEEATLELTNDDDIMSHAPTRYVTFLIGADEMLGEEGVQVSTGTSNRSMQSFTVMSPNVLDSISRAADLIADKLTELIDLKEK